MFELDKIVRANIGRLRPYSSARDEFSGTASIYLDANENPYGSPLSQDFHRYPDPHQLALKKKISAIKGLPEQNIFLGNGSDEAIDILYRIFCVPGVDNVIICPPTYGMYDVSANINDIAVKNISLLPSFDLDVDQILTAQDERTKLLFICSPNNPTGNSIHKEDIEFLIKKFNGIVVIDEAYINYSHQHSCIPLLTEYPNVVILQTFSKAWGLAGIRLGMAFASADIIYLMNKVKPPYNISENTQQLALQSLDNIEIVNKRIRETVQQRNKLAADLETLSIVQKIYPSDANFLLVRVLDAPATYTYLVSQGIIVRDRSRLQLCENCLRITVGTSKENEDLIYHLKTYSA
ncbi:MAG: histidinol-phosphate transaminase [Bacteroidetes bacterium]|nr:histidinol-phosphate transaminase [Bacteroidota bacterium]